MLRRLGATPLSNPMCREYSLRQSSRARNRVGEGNGGQRSRPAMLQHTHGPATAQITRDPRLKECWRAAAGDRT
jgi:hypothetical protein